MSITIPLHPLLIFIVVLARAGGLVTFAPFWSHRAATARVRVTLALALALVLAPAVSPQMVTPPTDLFELAVIVLGELMIGCVLGFVGRLVFSALEMAAQMLGFQMGFSLASTIDPATQAQTAALGTIAQMFGLVMLLAADGHHWLLAATMRSFEVVSPGHFIMSAKLAHLLVRLSADALAVGVALAAPAIVILLAVEMALAIAGRAAPQLQIMILGFPIKIAVGLWLVGASLYFLPGAVRTLLGALRAALSRAL
jgi:flagellar biosynthetic protein FliR